MRDQSGGSSQETDCNKGVIKTKSTSCTCQQTFAIPMQYVVEMLTNKLILFNTSSLDGDGGEERKRPNSL